MAMRRRMKVLGWVVILAIVLAGMALHFMRGTILRSVTVRMIEKITSFGVELADADIRLLDQTAEFTNLRLLNPTPFTEKEALHIARIHAEFTWPMLMGKRTWLRRLDMEISSITLVRPREGLSNLERLVENAKKWDPSQPAANRRKQRIQSAGAAHLAVSLRRRFHPRQIFASVSNGADPDIQIDELNIQLGRITVIDYNLGRDEPLTFTRDVNQTKCYTNVTNIADFSRELAIDFTVDSVFGGVRKLDKIFPGFSEGLKDVLKQADAPSGEAEIGLEEAVDLFKDLFKGIPQ